MSAEQLCFFKFPRPLLERFGKDFFTEIPKAPGVYVFSGGCGRALYVGHSRNLRERLSYYKNAQPEREPRRIVRLVHQVRRIELECCESLNVAQVRELALIRQLRPRFNIANTLSPTFSYFTFREEGTRFVVRLSMNEGRQEGETVVGGFRNRGLCARAFAAMARTVAASENSISTVYEFPAWLNARARHWCMDNAWRRTVAEFVAGEGEGFLEDTAKRIDKAGDPFLRQVFETDLVTLAEFYQLAKEMAELRKERETAVLSQEALQVSGRLARRRGIVGEIAVAP